MHESEVPESFIRQYFCYVDENHDGRISAIVEMPDKHFDSSLAKAGLRTEVHMRKEQKFSLGSLESYSKELMRNLQDLMRKTEEEFLSGSLGKTNVEGLEMFLRSASNPESNGGFLLTSHGRGKDEIKYCPYCLLELIEEFRSGHHRIVHPPIPETSLNLTIMSKDKEILRTILCPENIHKKVSEVDCISLLELTSKMRELRSTMGFPNFEIIELETPGPSVSSQASWVDISNVKL